MIFYISVANYIPEIQLFFSHPTPSFIGLEVEDLKIFRYIKPQITFSLTCRHIKPTYDMKKIYLTILSITIIILLTSVYSNISEINKKNDVIILKLMGKKLESAYIIDSGKETKIREGLTGDEALENYLNDGWEIKGTSVASDAGRFSVVYTLVRN